MTEKWHFSYQEQSSKHDLINQYFNQYNGKCTEPWLGSYDFQKKSWNSGYFQISDKDWAKNNDLGEKKYPILDDKLLMVHSEGVWATGDWGAVSHENGFQIFKMVPISSNYLKSLENDTIYSMSKNDSRVEFNILKSLTNKQFSEISYVPTSESELSELMQCIKSSDLESPTSKGNYV